MIGISFTTLFIFIIAVYLIVSRLHYRNKKNKGSVDSYDALKHPYPSTFDFNEKKEGKRGDPLSFHSYISMPENKDKGSAFMTMMSIEISPLPLLSSPRRRGLTENYFKDSTLTTINPASGLPMISGDASGVDYGGNSYGMDDSDYF